MGLPAIEAPQKEYPEWFEAMYVYGLSGVLAICFCALAVLATKAVFQ